MEGNSAYKLIWKAIKHGQGISKFPLYVGVEWTPSAWGVVGKICPLLHPQRLHKFKVITLKNLKGILVGPRPNCSHFSFHEDQTGSIGIILLAHKQTHRQMVMKVFVAHSSLFTLPTWQGNLIGWKLCSKLPQTLAVLWYADYRKERPFCFVPNDH